MIFWGCPALNCRCVSNGFHPRLGGERFEDGDGASLLCQLKGRKLVGFACIFGGPHTDRQRDLYMSQMLHAKQMELLAKVGCEV